MLMPSDLINIIGLTNTTTDQDQLGCSFSHFIQSIQECVHKALISAKDVKILMKLNGSDMNV